MIHCTYIQYLWIQIKKLCKEIAPSDEFVIGSTEILSYLVIANPKHIFNFIVLVTKQYIYTQQNALVKIYLLLN